ncbi:barstar family protein [Pelagicoccus sp. NFK12]|uniref:Barstar family protein n=1 Tax=Pelagicoccus enzymogenes TaxID=2773457 RepID=A0A927IF20_9BACT|nr:barstar family protein [Pelagicoccus enzymogenes]MBD5779652.1 barstar family protein [Pelagicoccus enzymogenes]
MKKIKLDVSKISDWDSFHDFFSEELGFPDYYGRNMDAWIDCVGDLFEQGNDLLCFELEEMKDLKERSKEIYEAINECSAFVNYRMTEQGQDSILSLSYA